MAKTGGPYHNLIVKPSHPPVICGEKDSSEITGKLMVCVSFVGRNLTWHILKNVNKELKHKCMP
jgi:hypothetical protein